MHLRGRTQGGADAILISQELSPGSPLNVVQAPKDAGCLGTSPGLPHSLESSIHRGHLAALTAVAALTTHVGSMPAGRLLHGEACHSSPRISAGAGAQAQGRPHSAMLSWWWTWAPTSCAMCQACSR